MSAMRYLALAACLSLLITTSRAADDDDEYKAFKGTWTVVKMELGGVVQKDKPGETGEFKFDLELAHFVAGDGKPAEFKHELRPKLKPAEINFFANSMVSKLVLRGIYKRDGDDLIICVSSTNVRPTKFKTRFEGGDEGGEIMFTLKRKK